MIFATFAVAQRMHVYNDRHFSLTYPSDYIPVAIKNAPHMHLKLQNNNYQFTASYWDKGYGEGTSIWDDEMYESCKSLPVHGDLLAVDKVIVSTMDGSRRSIRVMSTLKGNSNTIYSVSYLMIQGSYLYIYAFFSDKDIFLSNDIEYQKKILKGLSFQHNEMFSSDEFHDYLLGSVKSLNAQCPIKADDLTTIRSIVLSGRTICIRLEAPNGILNSIDYSILESNYCENFSKALPKKFFIYLKQYGYLLSYLIYDENNELHKILSISPEDIIGYYEDTVL